MKRPTIPLVLRTLKSLYPDARCTLDWKTPLELLVATILAAQCTDARVNIVGKTLFRKYRKPEDYLAVSKQKLERDIFSCGTYRMKAKAIRETCRVLSRDFGGKVPKTMRDMLTLRGVGRKTAAVVLATAYGVIEGIPVDTHVTRVSRRLGITKHSEQHKIELDLMKKTPKEDWVHLSHLLVFHGRKVCFARNRNCPACVFRNICPSSTVKGKHDKARQKLSTKHLPRGSTSATPAFSLRK